MANAQSILADYERKLEAARSEYWKAQRSLEETQKSLEVAKAAYDAAKEILAATEQPARQKKAGGRRQRSLTGNWQRLMALVHRDGCSFGYDTLEWAASELKVDVSKETMRSQMSNYKAAGLVEATAPGEFRLTPEGLKAAKIEASATTGGSQATDGAKDVMGMSNNVRATDDSSTDLGSDAPTNSMTGIWGDDMDDDIPF